MYYELYLDVWFLENFLMDYFLLLLLKEILRCTTTWRRLILAAAFGAGGVCILYAWGLSNTIPGFFLTYAVLSTSMVRMGLCIRKWRRLFRATGLLYLCAWLLGGIFGWLSNTLRFPVYTFLGLSLCSFWLLVLGARAVLSLRRQRQSIYEVSVYYQGVCKPMKAFLDTGNLLRDPYCQKPVSIVAFSAVSDVLVEEKLRYIPYHTIGNEGDLLPVFTADYLYVRTEHTERVIPSPVLGVAKRPLSARGEYEVILNPEVINV